MVNYISQDEIGMARKVLDDHTVKRLTKESAFECLLWCIASQAQSYEIASSFVYNLRDASHPQELESRRRYSALDVMFDPEKVFQVSKETGLRFANGRRFDSAIEYFKSREEWVDEVVNADSETREKFVSDVAYLGNKTFSFWHICLGGKNLIALDVHVMRGLKNEGIEIDPSYVNAIKRVKGGQRVRKTPNSKDYSRIENETRELFSDDERFLVPNGVDMALVDAVYWWRGANRGQQSQLHLWGNGRSWILPYSFEMSA